MRVQCSGPSRPQLRTQAKADRTLAAVEHQDRRRAVWKRVPNLVIPGTFDTPSAWSSRVPNAESYPLLLAFPPSCSILSDNQTVKFRGATSEFAVPLHMFLDLNVPIPNLQPSGSTAVAPQSKKGKAAAKQTHPQQPEPSFSPAQIAAIENRVELLIHRPSLLCRVSLALTSMNVQLDTRSSRLIRQYTRNSTQKPIRTLLKPS